MTYSAALALQGAVYRQLREDPGVAHLVGDAIFDAMPADPPGGPYVALGPEQVLDAGDMTARGSRHDFIVSVLGGEDQSSGFKAVKEVAVAVTEALERGTLDLAHGHLAGLWFLRANARRDRNGEARRVDLTFRARIDLG